MSTTTKRRARWTLVAALIMGLTGALVAPTVAQADEIVRTNADASLRARPGERAPTLAKLQEGQSVRVLGRQGRWLKVSVKGKVGWITRTQVDDDAEPVSARATADKKRKVSAKARKKGWSSMDDQAVGADAVEGDDEEASAASDEEETAAAAEEEEEAKPAKKVAKAKPVKKAAAKKMAKKSKKIAKGGEVVIVRSTSVREKASKKSDEKWEADKGAEMKVVAMSEDGDWIKVQDQDGEKGWVASKDLQARGSDEESEDEDVGEAIAESDSEDMDSDDSDSDDGETKSVRKKRAKKGNMTFGMNANVGVLSKQQTYASVGTGLRANYALANTAPAVIAGVGVMRNMGSFNLGLDGGVMMTLGGDGIAVGAPAAGQPGEQLAWQALEINVHANAQYMLGKKYAVVGRAGYHIASVTVDVSDEAKLPSEVLSGFTVGAIFEAPMLTDKIGFRAGVDFLLGGKLEQTAGLKDGTSSAASALFVNAGATYMVSSKLAAHATYTMSYETFGFAGVNEREATATDATRKDLQHVLGLGMAYQF